MDGKQLAKALQDLRTNLTSHTDIPEAQVSVMVGAAAGVLMALGQGR